MAEISNFAKEVVGSFGRRDEHFIQLHENAAPDLLGTSPPFSPRIAHLTTQNKVPGSW